MRTLKKKVEYSIKAKPIPIVVNRPRLGCCLQWPTGAYCDLSKYMVTCSVLSACYCLNFLVLSQGQVDSHLPEKFRIVAHPRLRIFEDATCPDGPAHRSGGSCLSVSSDGPCPAPFPITLVPDDASLPRSHNFPDRFSMVLRSESERRWKYLRMSPVCQDALCPVTVASALLRGMKAFSSES